MVAATLTGLRAIMDERDRKRFQLYVELRAVAAADIGHLDAHLVLRPAKQARDLGAHERGPLRGGVDGDAIFAIVGDRRERFERQMQDLLSLELMFELVLGGRVGFLEVAST